MRKLSLLLKTLIYSQRLATLSLCCMLILMVQITAFAQRGRPHLDSSMGFNRLLTDKNTLLRGVSLSWDGGDNATHTGPAVMPTQSQLNSLATVYGINCLHVYLEMDCQIAGHNHTVGKNAAICDQLVNMTAQANLYLIITIGCGNYNGHISSMAWSQQFWNFYAPRYANRTHVIYESHNEPAPNTPSQWVTSDWDNQVTLYNTIRAKAPSTHILTCTFMGFTSPTPALNGIGYMRWKGVDFSNASVAFHGYENQSAIQTCISTFKNDKGGGITPALLCTEFDIATTYSTKFNNMLEAENVGWLEFTYLHASMGDMDWFKSAMQDNNVVWTPDYGTWPRSGGSAPIGKTIWLKGSNNQYVSGENGTQVMHCNRPSVAAWESFTVVDAGGGKVALRSMGKYVSSENGTAAMNCNRPSISDWEKFDWVVVGTNQVALKGNNVRYVSSENGAASGMTCNRGSYSGWEVFNWGISTAARVATPEVSEPTHANLFPNPCFDQLNYNNTDAAESLSIIDLNGRLMLNQNLVPDMNVINVASLEQGLYVVKAHAKNGAHIMKIIKK
jgi:hypothetical protein